MERRRGVWVRPRFDPEQLAYPPASPENDPAIEVGLEDDPLEGRTDPRAIVTTGPLLSPDQRHLRDSEDAFRDAAHLEGRRNLAPEQVRGDPTRPR